MVLTRGGADWSPPPRGRGLKPAALQEASDLATVAPPAGARIETDRWLQTFNRLRWSPPPRGRGLKLAPMKQSSSSSGRPPRGGAD